ncbi:MAG: hypothetical protein J6A63_08675 [Clostridia bacterium]|nr:hypothetical protein [Clostridia bacterium]
MEIKDVEKRFEEAADNMELRSFSERWEIIKDDIKIPPQKKKRPLRKWLPAVAAACVVAISGAIIIPIALNNQPSGELFAPNGGTSVPTTPEDNYVPEMGNGNEDEVTYYMWSSLGVAAYGENVEELYQRLSAANFEIVDVSDYFIAGSTLFYITDETSKEQVVKGCQILYMDDEDNATFYMDMQVYDDFVKVETWTYTSDIESHFYMANQTEVEYWCTDFDGETYVYRIRARYKNLNYYIEYICFDENIEPFLDEFFK